MKNTLLAVPFALLAGLTATSAMAAGSGSGTINFNGKITADTCKVEIVNPESQAIGGLVQMGSVESSRFGKVGDEVGGRSFILRIGDTDGTCLDPAKPTVTITFTGINGMVNGEHYGIKGGVEAATGVGVSLHDQLGKFVSNGVASTPVAVSVGSTDLFYTAAYIAAGPTLNVTPGAADADVAFTVAFN